MVPVMSLWLPIVVAAVIVFVASSIIHMVLPYHKGDAKTLPKQDEIMDALRPFNIAPGDYVLPHCNSMKEMNAPEFQAASAMEPGVINPTRIPRWPSGLEHATSDTIAAP